MSITARKSLFAAAGVVAALLVATPVFAAEIVPPGKQAVGIASVKTASAPYKRHYYWPRYRVASWYTSHLHYVDATPTWQSYFGMRPALLMVGIAY